MIKEKSQEDIAELKSYYIKRLNEIITSEFDIDKANFGIYLEEHHDEMSHIIANKMGVEKFALSLLNSSLKPTSDYVTLEQINDWDYGDVFIQGVKFSDEKSINKAFDYDDTNGPFTSFIIWALLCVLVTSMFIGLVQIVKWIF